MVAEIARVVAGAVDQGRLAAAQKLHPHEVHARMLGDPTIVTDLALAIENRHLKPGIVRAIAGGPDNRPYLAGAEIHAEGRRALDLGGGKAVRRIDLTIEAILGRPFVDCAQQPVHLEIGHRAIVVQRSRELRLSVGDARDPANEFHADAGQRVEVQGPALGRASQLKRRHPPRPVDVIDLVIALVVHAGDIHPPLDILAPVDPRRPHMLPHGQGNRTA